MTRREMRVWLSTTSLEEDREDGADRPPWLLSYAEGAEGDGRRMETKRTREESWKRAKGDWEPRTGGGKKNSRKTRTGKPSEEETKCTARPERESAVHEVYGIREPQDIVGAVVQYRRRFNWVPAVPTQDNARSECGERVTRPSALSSAGA
ncbi:hypothetical protein FB451DRAFT_1437701 [Mycena latifolia]|nr:hypothetical protein FB451DRAFT_1437701 [Mycena latifolia]